MAFEESVGTVQTDVDNSHQTQTICLHAYADLSHISPAIFTYLLTEYYKCGSRKPTAKFRALQQLLLEILKNSPQPGPATFSVQCLYVFSLLGHPHTQYFSNLMVSCLCRLQAFPTIGSDFIEAQSLVVKLFLDLTADLVIHEVQLLIKLLEAFDVRLINIGKAMCGSGLSDESMDAAKALVESYVCGLIRKNEYLHAVTLLERFSIRLWDKSFLLRMMEEHHFKPAEKWAIFMGRPMLSLMVRTYIEMKMLKHAYKIIKKNDLQKEFQEVYYMYRESSLKTLAEKGQWDIAEAKTHSDKQLLEYLVYLAMEAGYQEKVDEMCERHSLKDFLKIKEEANPSNSLLTHHYLSLNQLAFDDIIWVDEVDGLLKATSCIEGCKVVGIDCEWKSNNGNGSKAIKVSIIQIAAENIVFIIDLIKLSVDEPGILNNCLEGILRSPGILKLGYNLHGDLNHLSHSYTELECFKRYEMLLDIQHVFKEPSGGLSGLSKKVLGAGLNKATRSSNWEQRPLSQNQMEYAALDAAVLVRIFRHAPNQTHPSDSDEKETEVEWTSNIVTHLDNETKPKWNRMKAKSKKTVVGECSASVQSD